MRIILYAKQVLLIALIMLNFQNESYSRNSYSKRLKKPGLYIGIGLGPSQSETALDGTLWGSALKSKKLNNYFGSAEIGYFFTRGFGLSTGVGYISYNNQLNLDTYNDQFSSVDTENETYIRHVEGNSIQEIQNIGLLTVPFNLNIHIPFSKSFGFFMQPGINVGIPMNKKYQSKGTYTFKGYYPAYNVMLENLPEYGFPSNANSVTEGELALQTIIINASASAGFDLFISKKTQISIAAFYMKSLSNISSYPISEKFLLSSEIDKINSFMGSGKKISLESMGVFLNLKFYLSAK